MFTPVPQQSMGICSAGLLSEPGRAVAYTPATAGTAETPAVYRTTLGAHTQHTPRTEGYRPGHTGLWRQDDSPERTSCTSSLFSGSPFCLDSAERYMEQLDAPGHRHECRGHAAPLQRPGDCGTPMNLLNPHWFPSIAWFRQYLNQQPVGLTPWMHRSAQAEANRSIIRGPNGLQQLSIPLRKGPRHDLREVRPLNNEKWAKECRHALKTAYGTSAFYRYYDYLIEPLLFCHYMHLFDMNMAALQLICDCLKLPEPLAVYEGLAPSGEDWEPGTLSDYGQYFTERYPFSPQVGVLDVLFHCGPLGGLVLAGKEI